MAYLGRQPVIGNFVKLDSITTVNGQAAYTMQNGGVNFTSYDNVNQFLVSLNGVLQAPTDSFTVSGSTLTFASNLSTGDVIDFVLVLGNSLDIGTPSDNTVTAAKLNNDIISGSTELASEPADTDEFLVSDAGTIKRIDYSLIKPSSDFVKLASGEVTSAVSQVDIEGYFSSTYENYRLVLNAVHPASASSINLRLKLSGSYATTNYYWLWNGLNSIDNHSTSENYNAYYNNDRFYVSAHMDTNQDRSGHSIIDIFQPYKTERHTYIQFRSIGTTAAANNQMTFVAGGGFQMTDLGACTGIRVFMSSGNIETMDYQLYGIKK